MFVLLMLRRPPISTLTYTLFPYSTLVRSDELHLHFRAIEHAPVWAAHFPGPVPRTRQRRSLAGQRRRCCQHRQRSSESDVRKRVPIVFHVASPWFDARRRRYCRCAPSAFDATRPLRSRLPTMPLSWSMLSACPSASTWKRSPTTMPYSPRLVLLFHFSRMRWPSRT